MGGGGTHVVLIAKVSDYARDDDRIDERDAGRPLRPPEVLVTVLDHACTVGVSLAWCCGSSVKCAR